MVFVPRVCMFVAHIWCTACLNKGLLYHLVDTHRNVQTAVLVNLW